MVINHQAHKLQQFTQVYNQLYKKIEEEDLRHFISMAVTNVSWRSRFI